MKYYKMTRKVSYTEHYEVSWVRPLMPYSQLCNVRPHAPKKCFDCRCHFTDEEVVYVGSVVSKANQLFCSKCGEKIAKELNIKDWRECNDSVE